MTIRYLKNPSTPGTVSTQVVQGNTSTFPTQVTISNVWPSTSAVTGALVVAGGVGITGNVNLSNLAVAGSITASSVNISNTLSAGAITSLTITNAGLIKSASGDISQLATDHITATSATFSNISILNEVILQSATIKALTSTTVATGGVVSTDISTNTLLVDQIRSRNGVQVDLGNTDQIKLTGGTVRQLLSTDGNGNLTWIDNVSTITAGYGLTRTNGELTLTGTGAIPGRYSTVTVDALGRVLSGDFVADTLDTVVGRNPTTDQQINITNSNESTDATHGALVVTGGVGISGMLSATGLTVGGTALFESAITINADISVINNTLRLSGNPTYSEPLLIQQSGLVTFPSLGGVEFDGAYLYVTTLDGRQQIQFKSLIPTANNLLAVRCMATYDVVLAQAQIFDAANNGWDGVEPQPFDRVLLSQQSDPTQNGIYIFNSTSQLERSIDASVLSGIVGGTLVTVADGAVYGKTIWSFGPVDAQIVVDSSEITLNQVVGPDAVSLANLSTDQLGLVTRTAYGKLVTRALSTTSNFITITNGTGASGDLIINTGVVPVTSGGTGRSSFYGYLKGVGTATTSANTIPSTSITGLGTLATQNANAVIITGGNVKVTSITANAAALSDVVIGNLTITNTLTVAAPPNLLANTIVLGTNVLGNLVSNALSLSTTDTVTNSLALMNTLLGKLVPVKPPAFPASQMLTLNNLVSCRMTNFVQVDSTATGGKSVAAGTVVNALRTATYSTNSITNAGPGDTGIVALHINNTIPVNGSVSQCDLTTVQTGQLGSLTIANRRDYHALVSSVNAGFWYIFDASATGPVTAGGTDRSWNELYITHSAAGSTNKAVWYADAFAGYGIPTFASTGITFSSPSLNEVSYSSGVPHFTNNVTAALTGTVSKLSGDTYPLSDTCLTGTAAGAFLTPTSLTYQAMGVPTPLARTAYATNGVAFSAPTKIVTGFGKSTASPLLSADNSYSVGTATFNPNATVLYKTGTSSLVTQIEEMGIRVASTVGISLGGTYSTGARIVLAGSTDTPVYTKNEIIWASGTRGTQILLGQSVPADSYLSVPLASSLTVTDATVVAAELAHDQTNYSVGYLPLGPDLSLGRAAAQYFTLRFDRTTVSKFDIKYSGTLAGIWVALPGSAIDSASTDNGWLSLSTGYNGAGRPGAGTGGNGSNGCAVGGVAVVNSAVVNNSVTATFGTDSSSNTADNRIYVRIKLTAGQRLTTLTIEQATH